MKTVIHWFRRDLRVSDNVAFSEAAKRTEDIGPPLRVMRDVLMVVYGCKTKAAGLAIWNAMPASGVPALFAYARQLA